MSDNGVETIVEKVRKILAKAESTNSTEEAEAFFAKAQELCTKHMIDEAMLAAAGGEQDVIATHLVYYGSTYWQSWRNGFSKLGRAFGFKVLIVQSGKNGFSSWLGWQSELKMAEMIVASIQIQVERAIRNFMNTYEAPAWMTTAQVREDRFKARRSFIEGFVFEVANRIAVQRAATLRSESEARGQTDGSLLPVLMSRSKLLDLEWDKIPTRRMTLKSGATNVGAHGAGVRAGRNADIGQPRVGGSKRALGS